jgi:TonB-linked SusC/RagA family outer membrane protein
MSQRITFIFLISCLLISPAALKAQNINVKGNVTSQRDGSPLPGVSIMVQGTTVGTSTDAAGNFTVAAPSGAKLTISQLGMIPQTITVTSSGPFNISLVEDSKALGEVVVVGYGTQKKSVVTGAISSVKASDLENQPVVRLEQSLQGRTSGLTIASTSGQPGSSATVRLRGFTSFGNDSKSKNNPLWVVDGVVIDNGGIGYLNQSDIESIEVLKDAASAAIYGARAASGVILITTKKGKEGSIRINYSGYYGTQAPAKKLEMLNATQYATVRNQSFAAVPANAAKPLPYPDPNALGEGTNWQSYIFNDNAPRQNHELSISGGSEKSTFYTSFGYTDIDGIVASDISKFNRANIRINTTYNPAKWITIGENLGYSHSVNSSIGETNREYGGLLSSAVNLDPIIPAIVTDPATITSYNNNDNSALFVRDGNGAYYGIPPGGFQEMKNPLAVAQTRLGNYGWDHNIVGNAFVDVEPVKGLHVRSTLGTKLGFYGSEAFTPISYFSNGPGGLNSSARLSREINYVINYNIENTVSYNRVFDKHNLTLLVGQGLYKDNNPRGATTTYANLPAKTFDEASFLYNSLPADRTTSGSDGTDHRVNSIFTRLQYNYAEKYLATFLVRRDGSSRFGDNYKFGYFPSASLGWVPTLEDFFPENNILTFLKIRGSYGVTGNDLIGDFKYLPTVDPGRNYTFGSTEIIGVGYSPNAPANPDLKWEETSQTDIGFDAVLFHDFTFTFDWYKKKTTGILQDQPVPGYTGSGSFAANVGDMENKGVEFELGYKKQLGDFKLGINGNASFFKNKVTKLLPDVLFIENGSDVGTFQTLGNITRTTLGRAYNEFYGYQNLGLFQSQQEIDSYVGPNGTKLQPNAKPGDIKFANLKNDEAINADDRTYLGNPAPKMTYGLTVNLAYKNFDISAFGSGVAGNYIFQGLRRLDIGTLANWQTNILNAWTPSNNSTSVPRVVEGDPNKNYSLFNSVYLEKGDYFRLRTLQLGYTFPKSITDKIKMQRLRVYVLSENLFTVTKYSGFDPELGVSNDAGAGNSYSIDRGAYPQARSFLFGLNVGF